MAWRRRAGCRWRGRFGLCSSVVFTTRVMGPGASGRPASETDSGAQGACDSRISVTVDDLAALPLHAHQRSAEQRHVARSQ
jgi:hypothetical protein